MTQVSHRSWRGLLFTLALLGLVLDQGSKYLVFHWLYNDGRGGERSVIPGAFELLAQFERLGEKGESAPPRVNNGALFGQKFGLPPEYANMGFAVVSLIAAVAIVFWSRSANLARDKWLCAALGLILAGTLGNLYDRVVFHGVRDFLHWYLPEWPVFNVADCCLVGGAILLLGQAFLTRPAPAVNSSAADVKLAPEVAEAK